MVNEEHTAGSAGIHQRKSLLRGGVPESPVRLIFFLCILRIVQQETLPFGERGQSLVRRRPVAGIDAHAAPEDVVHAVAGVTFAEDDFAFFE